MVIYPVFSIQPIHLQGVGGNQRTQMEPTHILYLPCNHGFTSSLALLMHTHSHGEVKSPMLLTLETILNAVCSPFHLVPQSLSHKHSVNVTEEELCSSYPTASILYALYLPRLHHSQKWSCYTKSYKYMPLSTGTTQLSVPTNVNKAP